MPPKQWCLDGLDVSIHIDGNVTGAVTDELATLMPGWPPQATATPDSGGQRCTVTRRPDGVAIHDHTTGADEIVPDAFSAAYAIAARAFEAMARAIPYSLVLHAGAVISEGAAIAFAGSSAAGKSCLGAALASSGHRLLGDDRIVVGGGPGTLRAYALGLSQKLRLPLPLAIASRMRPLIAKRLGRRIGDSLFLGWDPAIQCPAGEVHELGRVVVLERNGTAPAALTALSRPEAMQTLLMLSASPEDASAHLTAVRALVDRVPVFKLQYESCFEADRTILGQAIEGEKASTGD